MSDLVPFFARDAVSVARALIGTGLLVGECGGAIVETEAYRQDDAASHSYGGPTRRNATMFGPPGIAYVYRVYGIHWCLNFVCGDGAAVLIRALQPTEGLKLMEARRGVHRISALCRGPGNLTKALGITGALNGHPLNEPPFCFIFRHEEPGAMATGPRVGISRARELAWRFGLKGSPFVSRSFA